MVFAPYSYFYSLDIYFHLKHNKVQLKLINASMNTTTPQQHNKPYQKLYWAKKLRKIRNLTRCKSQPAKKLSKISLKIRLGVFFLTAVDKMTWEHKSFRRFRLNSDVLKTTEKKTFFSLSPFYSLSTFSGEQVFLSFVDILRFPLDRDWMFKTKHAWKIWCTF